MNLILNQKIVKIGKRNSKKIILNYKNNITLKKMILDIMILLKEDKTN